MVLRGSHSGMLVSILGWQHVKDCILIQACVEPRALKPESADKRPCSDLEQRQMGISASLAKC